jgi:hypothetical protein
MISSGPVRAWDDDGDDARVSQGFHLARKNKEQWDSAVALARLSKDDGS